MNMGLDIILWYVILFSVMSEKEKHIDWMDEQDAALTREAKQHDFAAEDRCDEYASPTHEDCGWFGYEGLCEDWRKPLNIKDLQRPPSPRGRKSLILSHLHIEKKIKKNDDLACIVQRSMLSSF